MLDILGLILGLAYIGATITSLVLSGLMSTSSYARLVRAVEWQKLAVGAAVLCLLVHFLDLADDGWLEPGLWIFNTVMAAGALFFVVRQRNDKGMEIADNAERFLRDWRP